ncbi:hypothetical protein ALC62_02617, partial [Cyphomyrmex costatus]
ILVLAFDYRRKSRVSTRRRQRDHHRRPITGNNLDIIYSGGGLITRRRRSRWDDNRNEVRKRKCSNPIIIGHIPRTPTTPMSGLEDRDF